MVCSFEVEIAELRWSCRPIFKWPPQVYFAYRNRRRYPKQYTGLAPGPSSRLLRALPTFRISKQTACVAKGRKTPVRREAMGGLAKGLAVIRAVSRDHAGLSHSHSARSAR